MISISFLSKIILNIHWFTVPYECQSCFIYFFENFHGCYYSIKYVQYFRSSAILMMIIIPIYRRKYIIHFLFFYFLKYYFKTFPCINILYLLFILLPNSWFYETQISIGVHFKYPFHPFLYIQKIYNCIQKIHLL